jgi:hypothetical protein
VGTFWCGFGWHRWVEKSWSGGTYLECERCLQRKGSGGDRGGGNGGGGGGWFGGGGDGGNGGGGNGGNGG